MAGHGNLAGPFDCAALGSAFQPILLERFNRTKRSVAHRAIHSNGNNVEFLFVVISEPESCLTLYPQGAGPGRREKITIHDSQTNPAAIMQCDAAYRLRQGSRLLNVHCSKYMKNTI